MYNIQVSHGEVSPLPIASPAQLSSTVVKGHDTTTKTVITSMQGKNLTITRTESMEDAQSVASNESLVSSSVDSFAPSSTYTLVNDPSRNYQQQQQQQQIAVADSLHFEISEELGKELVDNVRARYLY